MKWMVSSSTTPSVTLATMMVAMLSVMPSQPMKPRITRTGNVLATIASMPKRAERNTRKMTPNTVRNAVPKLLSCDITM